MKVQWLVVVTTITGVFYLQTIYFNFYFCVVVIDLEEYLNDVSVPFLAFIFFQKCTDTNRTLDQYLLKEQVWWLQESNPDPLSHEPTVLTTKPPPWPILDLWIVRKLRPSLIFSLATHESSLQCDSKQLMTHSGSVGSLVTLWRRFKVLVIMVEHSNSEIIFV